MKALSLAEKVCIRLGQSGMLQTQLMIKDESRITTFVEFLICGPLSLLLSLPPSPCMSLCLLLVCVCVCVCVAVALSETHYLSLSSITAKLTEKLAPLLPAPLFSADAISNDDDTEFGGSAMADD